jgi:hypothetical protein
MDANELKFEVIRAKAAADYTQKQFDSAVDFCLRMAADLKQAKEQGWSMICPANNLANAANEVGQIAERLNALLDAHANLKRIAG